MFSESKHDVYTILGTRTFGDEIVDSKYYDIYRNNHSEDEEVERTWELSGVSFRDGLRDYIVGYCSMHRYSSWVE